MLNNVKGMFSSGLHGASAIRLFCKIKRNRFSEFIKCIHTVGLRKIGLETENIKKRRSE